MTVSSIYLVDGVMYLLSLGMRSYSSSTTNIPAYMGLREDPTTTPSFCWKILFSCLKIFPVFNFNT